MTVYLVGAGPGDPGLLTRRGAELLARADVLVYDRLVDRALLELAPPGVELLDVGKRPARADETGAPTGAATQEEINALLIERGRRADTVVRLKGGDPFLLGRGGEEAEALRRAGVAYEIVPGVASAFAVPAVAGIPVTHRGVATSVTVVTGRVGRPPGAPDDPVGGPPAASTEPDWPLLARAGGTLVVLMGVATRGEIARQLLAGGRAASTPVAVIESGTTPGQRVARTTLGGLEALPVRAPAVLVIGEVAALDLSGPDDRPLSGRTVVVTRPRAQAAELTSALREAGATVIELPTIEIVDPPDGGRALAAAAADLTRYEWVVFTSANAVRRLLDRVPDLRLLAGVRVAAVGAATARALAEQKLPADLVAPPEQSNAEGLGEVFPRPATGSRPILHPRAETGRETLGAALRAKGWTVEEVVAYRTVAAPAPPDEVAALVAGADAVTFTSPSTATSYLAMGTGQGAPLVVPPVVACVGPVTASAARKAGLEVTVESPSPNPGALVRALAAHFTP